MEEKKEIIERKNVNLDTILLQEIGETGWFQVKHALLAALAVVFIGWSTSEYLFTISRIPTRCLVPECEEQKATSFSPPWLLNAIPSKGISFDNCKRFQPLNSSNTTDVMCPKNIFNPEQTIPCEEFIYENTHSIVYDFDLACDEWRRTFIGSMRTLGALFSMPLAGLVSDRLGRRTAIILTGVNAAWLGTVRYWCSTYVGFVISEFTESMFGTGGYTSSYILLMEMTGPRYRVLAGATMSTFFAIGQITTGLIAWAVPNWRNLTLTLYLPQFIVISYIWLMSESIRWYLSKGYYIRAEKILKLAARDNSKKLSKKCLEDLKRSVEEENRLKKLQAAQRQKEPWLPVQVFRHKPILLRVIVTPVWWITSTLIYYGLSINSVNMVGNKYLNFVLVSAVEIPGYWAAVYLMGRVGRKPVLIGAYWMCAVCQIGYMFIPDGSRGLALVAYLAGKCSISLVITSVYIYTAELYPTTHRHTLLAFSSMIGRFGSILAQFTPAFGAAVWEPLPFVLFAGFALLSGALVFLTPETRNTKLPDTMEEACNIGNRIVALEDK